MPAKSVFQYDCARCGRTWYENTETKKARLAIELQLSEGEPLRGSFDLLCSTCEATVKNYVAGVLKNLKKLGSSKPRAKKEGQSPPSKPTKGTTSNSGAERIPPVEVLPPSPSPSRPR